MRIVERNTLQLNEHVLLCLGFGPPNLKHVVIMMVGRWHRTVNIKIHCGAIMFGTKLCTQILAGATQKYRAHSSGEKKKSWARQSDVTGSSEDPGCIFDRKTNCLGQARQTSGDSKDPGAISGGKKNSLKDASQKLGASKNPGAIFLEKNSLEHAR